MASSAAGNIQGGPEEGEIERDGKVVGGAAPAEQHWCGSCRREPLPRARGYVKEAHMEGHHGESLVLSNFLFYGCVFLSAAPPAALPALQFAVVLPVLCS